MSRRVLGFIGQDGEAQFEGALDKETACYQKCGNSV